MSGYGGRLDGFNDDFDFAEAPPRPAPELEPPRVSVRYRPGQRRLQIVLSVLACAIAVAGSFFAGWKVGRDNVPAPAPVTVTADPTAPLGVPPVFSSRPEAAEPTEQDAPPVESERETDGEDTEQSDVGQGELLAD